MHQLDLINVSKNYEMEAHLTAVSKKTILLRKQLRTFHAVLDKRERRIEWLLITWEIGYLLYGMEVDFDSKLKEGHLFTTALSKEFACSSTTQIAWAYENSSERENVMALLPLFSALWGC
jgi:hypothetical protein